MADGKLFGLAEWHANEFYHGECLLFVLEALALISIMDIA